MAKAVGLTKQGMSLILCGEREMKLSMLAALCSKSFKVTVCEFFGPLPGRAA